MGRTTHIHSYKLRHVEGLKARSRLMGEKANPEEDSMTDSVLDHVLMKHCVQIGLCRSCNRDWVTEKFRHELPCQILFFILYSVSIESVYFFLCVLHTLCSPVGLLIKPLNQHMSRKPHPSTELQSIVGH